MSFDVNWDINKYREDHESDEQWLLRQNFMERWKQNYPEERLVCLARVFANIEFMGCRYPKEVMLEVATMSKEVANGYRDNKKTKLQRTFVSASDAAEDRARGVKRAGGIIVDGPSKKSNKIEFVKPGHINDTDAKSDEETDDRHSNTEVVVEENRHSEVGQVENAESEVDKDKNAEVVEVKEERVDYLAELTQMKCLDVRRFRYSMFMTRFGKMVLMVRSWAGKLWNILSSCQVCGLIVEHDYNRATGNYKVIINQILVAEARGATKQLAKKEAGDLAWNVLKEEALIVFIKERFIAQNDARISLSDVSGNGRPKNDEFGTPVETSVATKMMKMMGWKGGGLGVDAQGIAEPIKPHLQMVNRAGLGSMSADVRQIKRAAEALMTRYIDSDCLDVDLVFSNDFSKEERAALHLVAKKAHLVSRSYGQAADRFLVVRKKLDPYSLVQAVLDKGGCTPKYQVFIPAALGSQYNGRNIVR